MATDKGKPSRKALKMRRKSDEELEMFVRSGSLSAAAAEYEIRRRKDKSA